MDRLSERIKENRVKTEKKRHKQITVILIILFLLVGMIIGYMIYRSYQTRVYNNYKVVNSVKRADSNTVAYQYYNGYVLKYSRDGASAINASGNVRWNGSYEMDNPAVDVSGEYVAIADIGGKECYVYNGKDSGTKIISPLPILQVEVAKQGVVALLLEDRTSNVIHLCNPYSTSASSQLLAKVPTNVNGDGYPIDFDLSADGKSLVTLYMDINKGVMENKVSFYNFSEVGMDKNNLVGAKLFKQEIIAKVEFIDEDTVCIFREKGFTLFHNMKKPDEGKSEEFDKEIKSALLEKGCFGFIFDESGGENNYQITLYNERGNTILDKMIEHSYDEAYLQGGEILLCSDLECTIIRKSGAEKFKYTFDNSFMYFMKSKRRNHYYIINELEIQEVKLTKK